MKPNPLLTIILLIIFSGFTYAQTAMLVHQGGETTQFDIGDIEKITFDLDHGVPDIEKLNQIVKSFQLLTNYPNPFNPTTSICYEINAPGLVEIRIYDVTGREVTTLVSEQMDAGSYQVSWNGETSTGIKAAAGVYFYQLSLNGTAETKKMLLIK